LRPPPPPPLPTNVIYGQVFWGNIDEFCDAKKLHECIFILFSVVEWINIDVFVSYQVMADGFYTFERLEYQMQLVISN
jgi:hypothetical protein